MYEEYDRWGNPICGEDFMAGAICSRRPGHPGPHEGRCQNCDGAWETGTCECSATCESCGNDDASEGFRYCMDCLEAGVMDPLPAPEPMVTAVFSPEPLSNLREALCAARAAVHRTARGGPGMHMAALYAKTLDRLISDIDRQRPLGPDGEHGDRHTAHCQCAKEA